MVVVAVLSGSSSSFEMLNFDEIDPYMVAIDHFVFLPLHYQRVYIF